MIRNAPHSESLAARINGAERQRSMGAQGAMLRHRIHDRMTSPALLGSAAGLGFLLGNRHRVAQPEVHASMPNWQREERCIRV